MSRAVCKKQAAAPRRANLRVAPLRMAGADENWRGDWLCVDCGYEYKRGQKVTFENLPDSWRCPQCRAPKRRFAKKAGSTVQDTGSTSNTPIIVVSMVGLVGVLVFAIWAANNL